MGDSHMDLAYTAGAVLTAVVALWGITWKLTSASEARVMAAMVDLKQELRAEISDLKQELREEITDVKRELRAENSSLKQELREEIASAMADLKQELREEIASAMADLKRDLKDEIATLRTDHAERLASIDNRLASIEEWARTSARVNVS